MPKFLVPQLFRTSFYTVLIWAGLGATCSYGQGAPTQQADAEQQLAPRVPGSPTAAALERYALMPVSEHAGTPEVSIPLLEARSGSLALPVSLSYHASGVRVDDEASWVGLGWSLPAGGVITRVVRGKADESGRAFLNNFNRLPAMDTLNDGKDFDFFSRVAAQQLDYEPDLFNYSFPGGNGSFMLGNDGKFHTLPYQPLQIKYAQSGASFSFALVDNAGTLYSFAEQEFTRSYRRGADGPVNCTAWYLTQIVSADKTDTIRLEYDRHTISYRSNYYQSQFVSQGPDVRGLCPVAYSTISPPSTSSSNNSVQAAKLKRILFRNGEIVFMSQSNRADIISDRRLKAVALLRAGGVDTVRKVVLYHSYFNGDLSIANAAAKAAYLRLRLDSVQTQARNERIPPHRFAYSSVRLPTRGTGPRDHWGYANALYSTSPGLGAEPSLVPRLRVPVLAGTPGRAPDGTLEVGNANREPNPSYVQAGLLQRITYPTGGYAEYAFEPNTAATRVQLPLEQGTHYQEATGTGPAGIVRNTQTLVMGNFVEHVGGTLAIRRRNELAYSYMLQAGGRIIITDVTTPGVRTQVFNFNLSNVGPATSDDGFEIFSPPTFPSLLANRTYEIVTEARGSYFDTNVRLQWTKAPAQYQLASTVSGGVRVKSIRSQAAPGAVTQVRAYTYNIPGGALTSGYALNPFNVNYVSYSYEQISRFGTGEGSGTCVQNGCRSLVLGSQFISTLR